MFGIVKSEVQNYQTVLVLDLLLKKYFVHCLDHNPKLLFVPITGKSKRNLTPPQKREITVLIMEVYLRKDVMLQWAAAAEDLNLSNPPSVFFPVAGF